MKRLNTLTQWPNIHVCPFDLSCWCEWYLYGAPMRIHYKKRDWLIPGPLLWMADHRHKKMWAEATPVQVTGPDPTASTGEVSPSPANPVSREA